MTVDTKELRRLVIERDMMGTIHIKSGDFDFIQIRYQYPHTDNASTRALAEKIVAMLEGNDERDQLRSQVAALQANPQSYQSGFDAGRESAKAHVDRWRAEVEALRKIILGAYQALGVAVSTFEDAVDSCPIEIEINSLESERIRLLKENEALRKALSEISAEVDGNIRCAVRDVVNGMPCVQDIYGYCDSIDRIIDAAMTREGCANG